ncbi:MAG: hypothetical protein CFE45_03525 [Burkholderiales bacterium PBB5]|nr:MAG: hypothetical protein CFE45_03525 [Burkholderiales bacterium PBB5]
MSPAVLSGTGLPPRSATAARQPLAYAVAVLLLLALQFGPLLGLIGFRLTENPQWTLVGALRDMAVAALVALAAASRLLSGRQHPLPASAQWALGTAAAFVLLGLLSNSDLFAMAYNLRRLTLAPLLFAALLLIPWTTQEIERLFALVAATSLLVALMGLAEWAAPDALWTDVLQIEAYNAANGFDPFRALGFHESGRFYSSDLTVLADHSVRRAVSSYVEPTTLAAGMSAALVLALARQARGHRAGALLLATGLCGLLTVSKGYLVFLVILLCWRLTSLPSPRHLLLITVVCMAAAALGTSMGLMDGAFAHLGGATEGLKYLWEGRLLGEGIGNAGNYTQSGDTTGGDSGLGNAIAQTGVLAFLPLLWLRAMARDVLDRAHLSRDPGGPWLASWTMFWIVTYALSASSQGVSGNGLGFAILALYLHPSTHRSTP